MPEYVPAAYEHLRSRAGWARNALVVVIIANGASFVIEATQMSTLERARKGANVAAEYQHADNILRLVNGIAVPVTFLLCAVVFLMWFYRAYKNLPALGSKPKHSAGWAVGYWFVPILNLFRPIQVAQEIWRGSEPDLHARRPRRPVLLGVWWIAWILAALLGRIIFSMHGPDRTIDDLEGKLSMWMLADALSIVGAVLAICVVIRITNRQEQRAREIGSVLSPKLGVAT